jgi:beta-aspartyl-peptidase (threonine type)
VHGGAGAAPDETAADQRRACDQALALGWEILAGGGRALDAVVRAVVHLEDDPALNAGYGACLTDAGTVELDASIMEGGTRAAGAVALIRRVRNPVLLARSLMEHGPHLFMAGAEAEELAAARGLGLVEPAALVAPRSRAQWERRRAGAGFTGAATGPAGTVGAVALDEHGGVAAATSTGGTAGKRAGRVGDSALIGAGTHADASTGAASATGLGEAIIRATLACRATEHLRAGVDPGRAAALALAEVTAVGGTAGVILVDRLGRTAAAHTTPHMTWCGRRG